MAEQISTEELAAAFEGSAGKKSVCGGKDAIRGREADDVQRKATKGKIVSLGTLIAGLVMLVVGVVFLVLGVKKASLLADGDFLVSVGEWRLEETADATETEVTNCVGGEGANCVESKVVWTFTKIGKGTLTTNGHKNDYDFKWAIQDGKLVIETDWLYALDDEYEYSLDQEARVLILKTAGAEYKFIEAK